MIEVRTLHPTPWMKLDDRPDVVAHIRGLFDLAGVEEVVIHWHGSQYVYRKAPQ